jgi:hypothetical protein
MADRPMLGAWQMAHARQHAHRLLQQTCDIYRRDMNGEMGTSPVHAAVPCSTEIVNRLANPGMETAGESPQTPIRWDVRFDIATDVLPGDMLRIRTDAITPYSINQEFTVVGVRTPAEYALYCFADCEESAGA